MNNIYATFEVPILTRYGNTKDNPILTRYGNTKDNSNRIK